MNTTIALENFNDLFMDIQEESAAQMGKQKWKILIVDDDVEVHRVTKLVLRDFTYENKSLKILSAYSSSEAKELLINNPDIAVTLLDVVMEEEDSGLKLVKFIREELCYNLMRIVLRTGQPGQVPEERVIVDYDISDYKEKTELTAKKLFTCIVSSIRSYKLYVEVEDSQKDIIFTLGEIAEARSQETGHHVKRVAEISKLLAKKYGMLDREAEKIKLASPMHDVGKLAIPDLILNKPGKLTDEEYEVMKSHALVGYEMLNKSDRSILKAASIIALQHHEKYNGKGYPNGLKGNEIHIYGRITALVDVFDALYHDRVYRKAWDIERIKEYFYQERGQHFDPILTDLFFENLNEVMNILNSFNKDVLQLI